MGVDHHEPVFKLGFENSLQYSATKALFQEFSWVKFLCKFQGFNVLVSLAFARGLKDHMAHVGDLITKVSEKSIMWEIILFIKGDH